MRISRKHIRGASNLVVAAGGAIAVADFSCFDDIIRAYRRAIVIVEAIASRSAAGISGNAVHNLGVRAGGGAGGSGARQGIGGACVLNITGGGALGIANFSCF